MFVHAHVHVYTMLYTCSCMQYSRIVPHSIIICAQQFLDQLFLSGNTVVPILPYLPYVPLSLTLFLQMLAREMIEVVKRGGLKEEGKVGRKRGEKEREERGEKVYHLLTREIFHHVKLNNF